MVAAGGLAGGSVPTWGDAPPAVDGTSGQPRLAITSSTAVVTAAEEHFTMTAELTNTTRQELNVVVNLRVAREPFGTRDELDAWQDHDLTVSEPESFIAQGRPGDPLQPGETRTYSFDVPVSEMGLGGRENENGWGPRGLQISAEKKSSGEVAASATTYVILAPPAVVPRNVDLTVVAHLASGPGETRANANTRLAQVAEVTEDQEIAWVFDPLALVDQDSNAATEPLAQRLGQAVTNGKEVYGLTYNDIDETPLVHTAGGIEALTAAKAIGQATATEVLGSDVAAQVDWTLASAAHQIDRPTVSFMSRTGARAVLFANDQFANAGVAGAFALTEGPLGVASDAGLAAVLSGRPTVADRNRALAQSAFAAWRSQVEAAPPQALVVNLPRDWQPTSQAVELLDQLKTSPWVRWTSLSAAMEAPVAQSVVWGEAPWPGPASASVTELVDRGGQAVAFGSLTPDPPAYTARSLPPLLAPLSNSIPTGGARDAAAQSALRNAADQVPPVSVVVGSEVNLISDDGKVPVVVENASNEPVTGLVVKLEAQTNAIRVEEPSTLNLGPGQSATARVPVHALANGMFEVRVELLNADGQPVTQSATLTMRVRAEWENIGTAIVGAVVAVVLVFGLVSAARKRRAAKREQLRGEG
ncbi:MAG: DUF6049 family protein, partial [Bifidobacteriaceae bacterium]|jgi:hypothetical protein|nr:DUF6049 family protein [Bifidobacteriaceae bacterium]